MIGMRVRRRAVHRRTVGQAAKRLLRAGLLLAILTALVLPIQALAGAQVPFNGSDSGHFTITPNACGPGVSRVDISGAGKAVRIGKYTYRATECFGGSAYSGAFTMTAARGDALVGIYNGTVGPTNDPNVATYDQDAVVTGGIGRFAGATGEFHVRGLANLATGEYSQELSGTVSRPRKPRDR